LKFVAVPEALQRLRTADRLTAEEILPIVARLSDDDAGVREAALFTLLRIGAPATADVETSLLKVVEPDPSPYAREMALVNLRRSFGGTEKERAAAARRAMQDQDVAVQVRGLAQWALMHQSPEVAPDARQRAVAETAAFLRRYGEDCGRADKDWGWRLAGAALRS